MAETGADVLVDVIHKWGVNHVFGVPGDGIDGIMEALRKRQNDVKFIHCRHEEGAAFAAVGYAKVTGRLGCCIGTSGPGGIHLLNGLYDAKLDSMPVLAITGMQYHDVVHTYTQQDVELDKLFMDVCVYNSRVMGPDHVENVTELACRTALAYRGVSHVCMPIDFQDKEVSKRERSSRNVPHHVSNQWAQSARLAPSDNVREAAEVLNSGKKVVILAGAGAIHATEELEQAAEKLGAVIVKPLLGKSSVPDDSPYTTGGVGLLGTKPSQDALEDCDTLLMVGTSFPYIEFLPKPGQARGVQIELDPKRIGLRYPVEVGLVGDSKTVLHQLLPLLQRNRNRSFLEEAQAGMRDWNKKMEGYATAKTMPMKPQVVAAEIGKRLASNAIVTCDSGTIATWFARHIPSKRGQMHTLSGNLATMAPGLPYAIGAQVAYPERQVIAFVGDGGFTMLMCEVATAVKYKLPIKIFIIKNNVLGQIKWEQIVLLGNPEFGTSLEPNIDFAAFARSCGATGVTVDDPSKCGDAVERALNTPGPVVVEALVDPNEPPMPPKVTAKQAAHFAEALARGTADRGEIVQTILADKVRELV